MWRIYVSSTYIDLVEERRAVEEAIRGLGQFAVGMEDYAASDERPLDKCLSDVRSCQAYIGVLAWRYGFRPNGGGKSITQLEYEEAKKNNVPIYMFLLDEQVKWFPDRMPYDDQPKIKEFRQLVGEQKTVSRFRDCADLARRVTQSLAQTGMITDKRPAIPELVPYLCDRSDQEFDLAQALRESTVRAERPIVCVIHGDESEAHDKFLERLQKVMLPRLLARDIGDTGVRLLRLEWPTNFRTEEDMRKRLELSLSNAILDAPNGTQEEISGALDQSICPTAIHSHIITETWQQQGTKAFEGFLRFWQRWPNLAIGHKLMVFLFIKYQSNKSFGLNTLKNFRRTNTEIRDLLEGYSFAQFDGISAKVLTELTGPTLAEAQDWARGDAVARFCDSQKLISAIGAFYAEWESTLRPRTRPLRIPTEQLVPKLRELMSLTQLQEAAN